MAAQALEQSVPETKDKDQLLAISKALGVKVTARSKKADIISAILATTGGSSAGDATDQPTSSGAEKASTSGGDRSATSATEDAPAETTDDSTASARSKKAAEAAPGPATDEEPPAEWELEFSAEPAEDVAKDGSSERGGQNRDGQQRDGQRQQRNGQRDGQRQDGPRDADGESRNRRRRRRRKGGRPDEGPQGEDRDFLEDDDTPVSHDPVPVDGYLDMRDEGYGFVRVNNYLSSKKDAYVPVRMSRQFGLRKGDHLVGMMRPAGRNEKNPAMLEIQTVNGRPPEEAKKRRKFEDMTALFPDEKLRLENEDDPTDMTSRIIDLICPIGKGQRGLIVSPPKAGKTTVMKTIATSIERNNPEVRLIVLLIDERPEEVTEMQRSVRGEVVASTFDEPPSRHVQVAEMVIEKAKRLVEHKEDVVILLDSITRLARAYNTIVPSSGKVLTGGVDAHALERPKRFFGAARNLEEGGSLTIIATALIETGSKMDEVIYEEFKGTGNMELHLDRKIAEKRVYPAINVRRSGTRREDLLTSEEELQRMWILRKLLSSMEDVQATEFILDKLKDTKTNDEFFNAMKRK